MVCSKCGAENRAGRKFCADCAAPLAVACPSCGAANQPGERFCGECATPLAEAAASLSATARPGAASSANPALAERRLVSVLFADLVGFTPFAAERDAEEVRETLTRYFDLATDVIARYGGTVEKFIGDAVMAVWGAPTAHEDDAERAVRAALELVDAVRALGPTIEARAGVLTGEAVVTIGARNQGIVAGDLVNTASRLQSVAAAGEVLVGEATHRAASAAIAFDPVGPQNLKGKVSPVPAWRALRVVAQRRGHGRGETLEPPFVGREDELRLLKDALHATGRERRARLVSISGPAGIGKSRLAWELEKYADGVVESIRWHRGRSPAYGEGIAFWALGEMVRQRAGLAEGDDEATSRAGIAASVAEFVVDEADRRWVEPALLALLGLEPAPASGRDALFAGWRIFFENIARNGTAVLLFEDLQWADPGLLDFIAHLLEWSKGAPILVVNLARPELFERRPDWGVGQRHSTALALNPLSMEAMRALLAGLVPGLPEVNVEAILERADGIPLYAVETMRMLLADGRLEPANGAFRPVGELGQLAVPETLRSLVGARLDGLEPPDRRLLQDASVLGRTFPASALAAISEVPEADLEPRLRALVRRELLELEADPRSPERGQYGFVQSLGREVAYDTLARRDRRARHLAAAHYFETLGEEELAGVLASHYLAAYRASPEGPEADGLAAQARLALRGAADRAASLGGHEQAMAYIEQALGVTGEVADEGELLERAAESADAAAHYTAGADYARRAIAAYTSGGDRLGVGRAQALLGRVLIDGSEIAAAARELEAALANLGADAPKAVEADLLAHLSRALFRSGEQARAVEVADRALGLAERLNLEFTVAEALLNKATALGNLGRVREGISLAGRALRLSQTGGWTNMELRARNNLGFLLRGDEPARAREILRDGLDLARRLGDRSTANFLIGTMAFNARNSGEGWDEALTAVDDAVTPATAPFDRARLLAAAAPLRAARGEDLASLMEMLEAALEGETDPQIRSNFEMTRSDLALTGGDLSGAFEAGMVVASAFETFNRREGYPRAVRAAAWDGSLERARLAAAGLDANATGEAIHQALSVWANAAVAALEGRREEALAGFGESRRRVRDLGLHFELALQGLDMVLLLGAEEPEAQAAAEEARAVFERLRARPFLERLEGALPRTRPRGR